MMTCCLYYYELSTHVLQEQPSLTFKFMGLEVELMAIKILGVV